MEAGVDPATGPLNALLLRLGFTREAPLRQRWQAKWRVYDTHLYGLLAGELAAGI